jgi:hypothetical protein
MFMAAQIVFTAADCVLYMDIFKTFCSGIHAGVAGNLFGQKEVFSRNSFPACELEGIPNQSGLWGLFTGVKKEIVAFEAASRIFQENSIRERDFAIKQSQRHGVARALVIIDLDGQHRLFIQGNRFIGATETGSVGSIIIDQFFETFAGINAHDRTIV